MTNKDQWRYCPTLDYPADLQTRGLNADQFMKNDLWFKGPNWLVDTAKWPVWKPNNATVLNLSAKYEEEDN